MTIGYKKTEQQLIDIVHATNVSALHDLLTEAAQAGKTELVVQLSAFEATVLSGAADGVPGAERHGRQRLGDEFLSQRRQRRRGGDPHAVAHAAPEAFLQK